MMKQALNECEVLSRFKEGEAEEGMVNIESRLSLSVMVVTSQPQRPPTQVASFYIGSPTHESVLSPR